MSKILACVDGSAYSVSVCDHAAWAADRLSAAVEVVHVHDRHPGDSAKADLSGSLGLGEGDALLAELTRLDERRGRLAQRRSQLILDAAAARLRTDGVRDVTSRQRHGTLVDTVTEVGSAAAMIVIGKRGETAETTPEHLGGNLERVVRASHQPILVAAREFRPIRRVLIAYDGGGSAKKAVEYLASSPLMTGAECHIVVVGSDTDENRQRLVAAAGPLERAGLSVMGAVNEGHPERVIAATVESAAIDLLVMGAYGHSHIRHLIVGSTTTATLRASAASVLLFR